MIGLVRDKPLDFTPGTNWSYSNTDYILLGMIVEKVSGQSYADFLKANIFEPLGMKDSGYDRAGDILKQRASGYQILHGHVANADFIDMSVPFSAGGIYSTVEDMYRWNEALAEEGKLLSAESLKKMFTEYPEAAHEGQHYGYGIVISRLKFGKLLYYHGGGIEGFSSSIQRYPNDRVCIVVLSNLDSYKPWELGDHIASDLFRNPVGAVRIDTAKLTAERGRWLNNGAMRDRASRKPSAGGEKGRAALHAPDRRSVYHLARLVLSAKEHCQGRQP